MRITLLGTGCPVAHPRRGGASALVEGGGATVLVDCGSGVTQRLAEIGRLGDAIDLLLVTHLHTDHAIDFYQLVMAGWHSGRTRPVRVMAPPPVHPVIQGMMDAWSDERSLRIEWERRSSTAALEVQLEEVPSETIRLGGLEIEPVLVDHAPVEPAHGFVFRLDGRSVVLSGDTCPCPALIEAGQGCDLLIHDVYLNASMRPNTGTRTAETTERVARYHTTSAQVGGVAREMGAQALVLTHFVPPDFDRSALLAEVGADFPGPIYVGEDGMAFDLASGEVSYGAFAARLLGRDG